MTQPSLRVLMVFVDGIGLAPSNPTLNPLAAARFAALERLAGGQPWTSEADPIDRPAHVFRGIDATLGVEGLPQSGTGQATLLTGLNCALIAGRHYGPYPHSRTRQVIRDKNVFRQILQLPADHPRTVAFANAYPQRFYELAAVRDRWTVTTRCCLDTGVEIRGTNRLRRGQAVAADITGLTWPEPDARVVPVSERKAASRLWRLARDHCFTLFEYYLTDKAGHARDADLALKVLKSLEAFFDGLVNQIEPSRELLLVTSDHGNVEDLSTKGHTRNRVPLIAIGAGASAFSGVRDIAGVLPALLSALQTQFDAASPRSSNSSRRSSAS